MSTKSELWTARTALALVLDDKLKNMPEWRAFRAIDKLLVASLEQPKPKPTRKRAAKTKVPSYGDLGFAAIKAAGRPQPTSDIMAYVASRRQLGPDPKKARLNVQSALSRDERLESIPWRGGRAWWMIGLEVPKDDTNEGRLALTP